MQQQPGPVGPQTNSYTLVCCPVRPGDRGAYPPEYSVHCPRGLPPTIARTLVQNGEVHNYSFFQLHAKFKRVRTQWSNPEPGPCTHPRRVGRELGSRFPAFVLCAASHSLPWAMQVEGSAPPGSADLSTDRLRRDGSHGRGLASIGEGELQSA